MAEIFAEHQIGLVRLALLMVGDQVTSEDVVAGLRPLPGISFGVDPTCMRIAVDLRQRFGVDPGIGQAC
ncbi:hypothetical protein [Nonomuraea sp. NPDC048826]|uniref:hypothetical protein n=1 Tax=Nonomuraea sp. NPDC048826 TaxID=3364347 RepID=UPI00372314CE